MPMSNYLRGKLIDHVLRQTAYTVPSAVYLSLHTSDPTPAATAATEVSASWYARQSVTFATQTTAGQTSNTNNITFNAVTGSAVTVSYFGLWDSLTLGNMLESQALTSSKTFNVADVPSFTAGSVSCTAT